MLLRKEIYWIKYLDGKPVIMSFTVGCAKLMRDGYKYGSAVGNCMWVKEELCASSPAEAVDAAKKTLEELL